MPDSNRILKTGAILGFICAIAVTILNSSSIRYFNFASFVGGLLLSFFYLGFISVIFGLALDKYYDRLPGEGRLVKSIILSIYSWVGIFLIIAMFSTTSSSRSILFLYQILVYFLIVFVLFSITYTIIFERIKPTPNPDYLNNVHCPYCGKSIQNEYSYCPYCQRILIKCITCGKIIKEDYYKCPYCKINL